MVLPLMNPPGRITTEPDGHEPPGRGSQTRFGNHCTPITPVAAVGEIGTAPVTSGRSVASPVSEFAFAAGAAPTAPTLPANSVTGFPLCDCVMNESCQPSFS